MRAVSSNKMGWMAEGRTFIAGPFGECGGGCGTRRGLGLRPYFSRDAEPATLDSPPGGLRAPLSEFELTGLPNTRRASATVAGGLPPSALSSDHDYPPGPMLDLPSVRHP